MTEIKDNVNDKPLVRFNEKGFVLNYSVTRNEEIAFIDYETNNITFKQMPLPIEKLKEMIKYYDNNKKDHETYLAREKEDDNTYYKLTDQQGFLKKKAKEIYEEQASFRGDQDE